jgi:hypothetical protein
MTGRPVRLGFHLVLDCLNSLLGRFGVDVVLLRSSFPHSSDVEPKKRESFVDMDHAGLLRRQPQPQRGDRSRHLLPQGFGVLTLSVHHYHEIVGETDQPPVSEPFSFAGGPLSGSSHLLSPLLIEVFIEHRQCDVCQ